MRDQERIARALHDRLRATVTASLTLNGKGVHWSLELVGGSRRCTISCFWFEVAGGVPSYRVDMYTSRSRVNTSVRASGVMCGSASPVAFRPAYRVL